MPVVIRVILRIIYWVLLIFVGLITAGTLANGIPVLGEISTLVFLPLQKTLCIAALLLIVIAALFLRNGEKKYIVHFVISAIIFLCFVFINVRMTASVNSQGASVNFFKVFTKSDFSDVLTETRYYTDATGKEMPLNIYYTSEGGENRPLVVYTHGGGWTNGTREDHEDLTKSLAQKGFVVASIEYDLSSAEVHLWDTTENQILHAMLWLKDNIQECHGSIDKLYMIGDSAGGNLALDISYKINSGTYAEVEGEKMPVVTAVSVIYPAVDIADLYSNTGALAKLVNGFATNYIGGSPEEYPERYEATCQNSDICAATPPTMIVYGANDSFVPTASTEHFIELLEGQGVEYQSVKIPYGNHLGDMNNNAIMGQAYLNNTVEWFETH